MIDGKWVCMDCNPSKNIDDEKVEDGV